MKRRVRPWTSVDLAMIREFYPIMPKAALAFVMRRTPIALRNMARKLGVRSLPETIARYARFQKGHASWNKGMKGWESGGRSAETRFKPGRLPHTWKPIGTYRVNADGYLDRKVSDTGYPPRDWIAVHRLVWAEANGPIPPGHFVTFKPGRRTTEPERITPDALELVTRQELMRRNSVHTRMPPELARLVQLRGALIRKIRNREGRHP